jgi:hypothetical protein
MVERKEEVTYYEGEMKFCLQFSLTGGIPPILSSDDGKEVISDLVTERPVVRQLQTGGFKKSTECLTLLVDGEGEICNVEKLRSRGDILV